MDEHELECRLCLSSAGGYAAAHREVCEFVFAQAGLAFANNDDKAAQVLRELGHKLRLKENDANQLLEHARIELADAAPIMPGRASRATDG